MMRRVLSLPTTLLAVTLLWPLSGCEADQRELQDWMEQQRREARPNVEPLTPPKKFEPVPYAAGDTVDPFSRQKLNVAVRQESRQPSSLFSAEQNRRKEPLEAYPLDSMAMVGSLRKGGVPVALLRVEGLLYQVKPGEHIGQNFGRITRIGETELVLREIVQDAAGEWIERDSTLQLQAQPQQGAAQ